MFYQNLRKRHKLSILKMKAISRNSVDIKKIREYYELYANIFENLDKTVSLKDPNYPNLRNR